MRFYVLDGYTSNHVNIAMGISSLWKQLAFMESDAKRLLAMHNRRLALMKPLLDALNHRVYGNFARQLSYDCGIASADALDMKSALMEVR